MKERQPVIVTDQEGLRGTFSADTLHATTHSHVRVHLDDGREVMVPIEILQARADGTYYLPLRLSEMTTQGSETQVIPVVAETLHVDKRTVETGRVRVTKVVREREEVVDEPLLQERVDIQRVPINQVVDGPLEPRREGNTLIIPVVEEVLVVEKRLVLTEEIHITKQQVETHQPQQVTLRVEEVHVERLDTTGKEVSGIEPA